MPWDGIHFRLDSERELGPWAREMRIATRVSSVDVGEAMDCPHNQICSWERVAIIPNLRRAIDLVQAHGYDVYLVKKGRLRSG